MNLPKTIETNRLILRLLNKDDFEFFLRIIEDKSVSENLNYTLLNVDLERPEFLFKSIISSFDTLDPILCLIIINKNTNENIGSCGLRFLTNRKEAICFYSLIPLYRGSGYAIESMKKLMEYGFLKMHLSKISIFINPKSKAVWKVAERAGMKYLGHVEISGVHPKAMYLSIEKDEFIAQQVI